ncbi:hypothetical protein CYMTET_30729 [Cymbomonas tetramitiformis]|uniref:GTP cyclohydrolase 1 n=1 Tax=Cymbomonas tetramitiformis TaxID=36881 RepID=A0AAE0C9Y1_9CHLO|nr:hypothetical protein CYMTET_39526 [Cymbomonas tetramitiformis]KAK3251128.1 hypothetical protein CYMTET_39525 [Cymbomonas tetramitiformis]KAK3260305.1 hypothetical protein CYMTET_30729 [Cymbomonas tetramitiformis]|eukprot:gene4913-5996_t
MVASAVSMPIGCESSETDSLPSMASAVKTLLEGLGEDVTREGLHDTPKRVAKAMAFAARGYRMCAAEELGGAVFSEGSSVGDQGNLVLVRDVELFSTHRSDLMPFFGRVHLAYVPSHGRVVGLSKFARIAEVYAKRLQTPENLAQDLAEAIFSLIKPYGVGIVLETRHMTHESSEVSTNTSTSSRGCLADPENWDELMELLDISESPTCSQLRVQSATHVVQHSDNLRGCSRDCAALDHADIADTEMNCDVRFEHKLQHVQPKILSGENLDSLTGCVSPANGQQILGVCDVSVESTEASSVSSNDGASSVDSIERSRDSDGEFPAVNADVTRKRVAMRRSSRAQMESAALRLIRAVHGPCDNPELHLTPQRFVSSLLAATCGYECGAADMPGPWLAQSLPPPPPSGFDKDSILVEANLPVSSLCEHHLLPFHGVAHVGYLPGTFGRLPRSLLERIVCTYSHRPQVQERLNRQVAHAVAVAASGVGEGVLRGDMEPSSMGSSWGVMVVVEAGHLCMHARGVEKISSSTSSRVILGAFAVDGSLRTTFLRNLRAQRGSRVLQACNSTAVCNGDH